MVCQFICLQNICQNVNSNSYEKYTFPYAKCYQTPIE